MNTNTYQVDRQIMTRFVWNQVWPDGETVILAKGGDGLVVAIIIPVGDGRTGYELEITTNCPEWATLQEIYEFYRCKDMTFAESQKQFRNELIVSRCQKLFDEGSRLFPERIGVPQHRKDAKPPRITVDAKGGYVVIDNVTYGGIDVFDCLILRALVNAKGNWVSRAEMQQAEPQLKNEGRIDRRIKKLRKAYPLLHTLIEPLSKGYRINPSMFV